MADNPCISQVKIGAITYDIKAKTLTDKLFAQLKQSVMTYKGPITKAELNKLTNQQNGDVYTITDDENKEVVWYKGPNDTTGKWVDIGYDDAHAHSVTINKTKKLFGENSGMVDFTLTNTITPTKVAVYNSITNPGAVDDPTHKHTITGAPAIEHHGEQVQVSAAPNEESATYIPAGTISEVLFNDYVTGINKINYTPKGNLNGGSASIPPNTVVTDVKVTSDAISSVKVYPTDSFDNLHLINAIIPKEKDVSVTGTIPADSFVIGLSMNSSATFNLVGTPATIKSNSFTPAGSVVRKERIIASVAEEVLTLEHSIMEATGAFTGTPTTTTAQYTPAGSITIPSGTYAVSEVMNTAKTITSTGAYKPSIDYKEARPYNEGAPDSDILLFSTKTTAAATKANVTKNTSAISCDFTAPTFAGTPATITPSLNVNKKSVTPTFTGVGVRLMYDKATSATKGTLAVEKSSTGIIYSRPSFGTTEVIQDITSDIKAS